MKAENPQSLQSAAIQFLCRHLVGLGLTYVALDENGRPTGPERFFTASGFIMSFLGEWYYVTAGHVLQTEIDERLATGQIQITRAVLVASGPAFPSSQS